MKLETPAANIFLDDRGILFVCLKDGVKQNIEMARENVRQCIEVSKHQSRPMLLDMRSALPISPDVRRYYADKEVSGNFLAMALLVEASPFGRALGNFYLNATQKLVPKKLFTDEGQAVQWLTNFLSP